MTVPRLPRFLVPVLCLAVLLAAGCASLRYAPGTLHSTGKGLVFGKILLVRDGEVGTLSPISTPITIHELESTAEPLMIVQSFEGDGRFHWLLSPGRYVLTMGLYPPAGDVVSCSFTVPEAGRAYYFGELRLVGRKEFHTISGANVRDVKTEMRDDSKADFEALARLDPGIDRTAIGRLEVTDISEARPRQEFFRAHLDAKPLCCASLSQMRFEPLPAERDVSFDITGEQGVFAFPEGLSCFRAFALPPGAQAVSITSHPFSSGIIDRLRIFSPAALLLDEDFSVVARVENGLLAPVPASLLPPAPAKLAGVIDLAALDRLPRYIVLYTNDQLLGAARFASRPGFVSIPGGAMLTGLPVPVGFVPWVTGKLTMRATVR